MVKNSLSKEEEEFLEIGEQKKDKIETEKKLIHFDDRQYSVKFPKKFIDTIEYKEGDFLLFTLIKPFDINKEPNLKIEYKRKNVTNTSPK